MVQVRVLARAIVLCSWVRHFTLTVLLSTQVYKWVPVNCWGKPNKLRVSDMRWTSIPSRMLVDQDVSREYRPHYVRSVLTTSVKILGGGGGGGGVEILLAASCHRNSYKFRQLPASRLQSFTFLCVGECIRTPLVHVICTSSLDTNSA